MEIAFKQFITGREFSSYLRENKNIWLLFIVALALINQIMTCFLKYTNYGIDQ